MKTRRKKDYYTIDPKVYNKMIKYLDDNDINKSKFLERLVIKFFDKK